MAYKRDSNSKDTVALYHVKYIISIDLIGANLKFE
jgi:hypothetical protein